MQRNPKTLTTLRSSGMKRLLTSLTFSFSIRGERDSIFTLLTVPTSSFCHPPPAELPGPESNFNSLTQQTRCASRSPQLDCPRPGSNLNSLLFSKITKILSPSLPGMTSFTPQLHFSSGVFIMTSVIVTSSAHEREHLHE